MPLFGLSKSSVSKMETKRNVEGLIKALAYTQDHYVRLAAAEALGNIGDARAVDALFVALDDKESFVRWGAANALEKIGGDSVVTGMIKVLHRKWFSETKQRAVRILANIGSEQAIDGLIFALKDEDKNVRTVAAEALQKTSPNSSSSNKIVEALNAYNESLRRAALNARMAAIHEAISFLKDQSGNMRIAALKALDRMGELYDVSVVEALLANANKIRFVEEEQLFSKVLLSNVNIRAENTLVNYLKCDSNAANMAALGLKKLGKDSVLRAFPQLLESFEQHLDGAPNVHSALVMSGKPEAVDALLKDLFTIGTRYSVSSRSLEQAKKDLTNTLLSLNVLYSSSLTYSVVQYTVAASDMGSEADKAVTSLCEINSPVTSNILHIIANRRSITVEVDVGCGPAERREISFENQREQAKNELKRRGNPPYQLDAYSKSSQPSGS